MFYIVYNSLYPNSASGNRFLSILRGFDELGIGGVAVLLFPSSSHYRIRNSFQRIRIKYLWKDWFCLRMIFDRLYRPFAIRHFLSTLKKGDVVFLYGYSNLLSDFLKISGIQVYQERTEHPELYPGSQVKYLEECKRLNGLFVISTSLKKYFINKGVDENKILIVNMVVDFNRFLKTQKTATNNRYIAYCGTASNNKDGVDELIKSFAIVSRKHADVELFIIGTSPSVNDESGNLKLIETLGIKDKVKFTGVVEAEYVPQLLKNATILALNRPDSLQAQNGFPTKLGEYLMTGNPVVVTKVGDIPLFLKDGETALLAEQRNPEDFASKLCWVLEHTEEAMTIGEKGKEVALREFNYLIESKKIIDFIYGRDTYCW